MLFSQQSQLITTEVAQNLASKQFIPLAELLVGVRL